MDIKTFIETNYNAKFIDVCRNYADWENITCETETETPATLDEIKEIEEIFGF